LQIFFSYARADKPRVVKIIADLESHGVSVSWDRNLIAGDRFRERIGQWIDAADRVVVLWTEYSVKSAFVIDEAKRGAEQSKLIPMRIGRVDIPLGFGEFHTANCELSNEELYSALQLTVGEKATSQPPEVINISKAQRLILSNQYNILRTIEPNNSDYYKSLIKCLEDGYLQLFDPISVMSAPLDNSIYDDVFNILDMFRSMRIAFDRLADKSGIDQNGLIFRGFDGNYESSYYGLTAYLFDVQNKYEDLHTEWGCNSHFPMLPSYIPMLKVWISLPDRLKLSKQDILNITLADTDPELMDKYFS
jgi:uncharacterized protein